MVRPSRLLELLSRTILTHNRKIINIIIPGFFLAFFLVTSISSVSTMSDTTDEKFHLTRGVMLLETGDLRLNQHHPYLFNLIAALPTKLNRELKIPDTNQEMWKKADKDGLSFHFVEINGGRENFSRNVVFLPRVTVLFVGAILLILTYFYTIKTFGPIQAIILLSFLTLSATVNAHAALITTDFAAMLLIFLACLVFLKFLVDHAKKPFTLNQLAFFSIMLFVMLMAKYTAVFIILPLMIMLFIHEFRLKSSKKNSLARRVIFSLRPVLIVSVMTALLLTAAYKFQFATLYDMAYGNEQKIEAHMNSFNDLRNTSELFGRSFEFFFMNIPVPFPQYVNGFFENVFKHNVYGHSTFFMGEFSNGGWKLYFPVAFLLKEPLGTIIFLSATLIGSVVYLYKKRPKIRYEYLLFFSIPVLLGILSISSSINLGIRHILPIFPFIFLTAGIFYSKIATGKNFVQLIAFVSLFLCINLISLVNAYPYYIPYFNILAGGSNNGYNFLRDSNFDWEQSLLYKLDFARENKDKQITFDPNQSDQNRYLIIEKEVLFPSPRRDTETLNSIRTKIESGEVESVKDFAVTDLLIDFGPEVQD